MKRLILILTFYPLFAVSQNAGNFQLHTIAQLGHFKNNIDKKYYKAFQQLMSKRDIPALKKRLDTLHADLVYIIEGYNFETGKYGIFESYWFCCKPLPVYIEFLDGKRVAGQYSRCILCTDMGPPYDPTDKIDTIFPRQYKFGGGCIVTDSTEKIFASLREQAKKDGVVIESYCKIETVIDRKTNQLFSSYMVPVKGERTFQSLGYGDGTEWPAGLDFWLFVTQLLKE